MKIRNNPKMEQKLSDFECQLEIKISRFFLKVYNTLSVSMVRGKTGFQAFYGGSGQKVTAEMVPKILVEEKEQELLAKDETIQVGQI